MTERHGQALYERFLRGLVLSPDRPAVSSGSDALTYRETHQLALGWAGALLALSAKAGTPDPTAVGVLAGRGIAGYVGVLAALYTGAAVVPLNPGFPAARLREMIDLAGVSASLADAEGLAALAAMADDAPRLPVLPIGARTRGEAPPESALREPRPVDPDAVAYLLFTSGSTGRPKGVPIRHSSAWHYFELLDRRYRFAADDAFSQTFDLNFDCAMFDLFCAWGSGARLVHIPAQRYRDLPEYLTAQQVTVWFSTPSAITLVRRMSGLAPASMPTLRWSFFAGEALRCADADAWQVAAPGAALENLYGPTEATVTITSHRWDPVRSMALSVDGLVPIGALHRGHEAMLLRDNEIHADEGELCITGPQLTAGYLDPADNAGRFLRRDGMTWYRTGDRVRRLELGQFAYLGRLDSQVQVNGWRVELAEVEHAVCGCPGVEQAIAVPRTTDGSIEIVVFYTGTPMDPAMLGRLLRPVLPHGMLPRDFRHLAELPLNGNRKTDRRTLAGLAAARPEFPAGSPGKPRNSAVNP
ncbi:AMP-binding protein [Nocardia sp. NPDC050175]|uniref:AMP-binding protein n=1 Tax=Nocardia sp. NPDC050175 TaxID=3364317 RepID=UPI0037884565